MKVLVAGWVDRLERELLEDILAKAFDDLKIELVGTEHQFRERLLTITSDPVDLVFMAVKFPWTTVSKAELEPPPDVVREGYHVRAGFRCEKLLHACAPHQPLILHSVGSKDEYKKEIKELPSTTVYMEDHYNSLDIRRAWRKVRSQ